MLHREGVIVVAKKTGPDVERFLNYKSRINDLYENCGDAIRQKKTVRATAGVFADLTWMIGEIDRLAAENDVEGPEPVRYNRIKSKLMQICKERQRAIKGGQFIDMSAEVFARYRYLVLELEKIILPLVDDDDRERITGEVVADENANAVTISLTDPDDPDDGAADDDATDTEKKGKSKRKLQPVG